MLFSSRNSKFCLGGCKMISNSFLKLLEDRIKEIIGTEREYTNKGTRNINSINILLAAFLEKESKKEEYLEIMKCLKGFEAQTLIIDKAIDNPKTEDKELRIIISFILQSTMTSKFCETLKELNLPSKKQIGALEIWNKSLRHVYIGQGLDFIYTKEKIKPLTLKEYLLMIKETTAILMQLPLYIGCLIKDYNKNYTKKIMNYGINIGLAFQIKDDYEDFENDIFEGKQRVFVIKESLDLLSDKKRQFIFKDYRKNPKKWIELIKKSKIPKYIIELNNDYVDKAVRDLEGLEGSIILKLKDIAELIRIK